MSIDTELSRNTEALRKLTEAISRRSGDGSGGGSGGGSNNLSDIANEISKGVKSAVGMMLGTTSLVGGIALSVKNALSYTTELTELARRTQQSFSDFKDTIPKSASGVGITTTKLAEAINKANELVGQVQSPGSVAGVAQVSRFAGFDFDKMLSVVSNLVNYAGGTIGSQAVDIANVSANSGSVRGERIAELTLDVSKQIASLTATQVNYSGRIASLFADADRKNGTLGLETLAKGIAGFNGFLSGGGGIGQEMFKYELGRRLGASSIYGTQYKLEEGIFAENGKTAREMFKMFSEMSGGNEMLRLHLMSNATGLSMHQAQAAEKLLNVDDETIKNYLANATGKIDYAKILEYTQADPRRKSEMVRDSGAKNEEEYLRKIGAERSDGEVMTDAIKSLSNVSTEIGLGILKGIAGIIEVISPHLPKLGDISTGISTIIDQFKSVATKLGFGPASNEEQIAAAKRDAITKSVQDDVASGNITDYNNTKLNKLIDDTVNGHINSDYPVAQDKALKAGNDAADAKSKALEANSKKSEENTKALDDVNKTIKDLTDKLQAVNEMSNTTGLPAGVSGSGIGGAGTGTGGAGVGSGVGGEAGSGTGGSGAGTGNVGGGTGAGGTGFNPTQASVAARIMSRLTSAGFSSQVAAAMVGNLDAESGLNSNAVNPSSGAYGLAQWTGSRRPRGQLTEEQQIDKLIGEMKGPYKNVIERAAKAKNLNEAVDIIAKGFEAPSEAELSQSMSRRQRSAANALSPSANVNVPRTGELNDEFSARLEAAKAEFKSQTGRNLQINSGFRSHEQQAALYAKLKPKGAKVAAPGNSMHEFGFAVDVAEKDLREFSEIAKRHGLIQPFPTDDAVHFEPVGIQDKYSEIRKGGNPLKRNDTGTTLQPKAKDKLSGEVNLNLIERDNWGREQRKTVRPMSIRDGAIAGEMPLPGVA